MTEAEWLACENPKTMLIFLAVEANQRRLLLFGCACCRRISRFVCGPRFCEVLAGLEAYADGDGDEDQRIQARQAVFDAAPATNPSCVAFLHHELHRLTRKAIHRLASNRTARNIGDAASEAVGIEDIERSYLRMSEEKQRQLVLLRDIFGNPFRPSTFAPAWRTPSVTSLAQAAYEERELPSGCLDLSRLAVLSDALEEAGCTYADILSHLRSPGPHVRGCWALDLVLGKHWPHPSVWPGSPPPSRRRG